MCDVNCSSWHGNLTWEVIQKLIESGQNNDRAGDATWILTSAFIIFTMQSGFGLLEAGNRGKSLENEFIVLVSKSFLKSATTILWDDYYSRHTTLERRCMHVF